MNAWPIDFRNAWRQLQARPLQSAVAILVLALGLGACASVFSLVNAVYFRPLGFSEPDRLLQVYETSPTRLCPGCIEQTSHATLDDVRAQLSGVADVEAFATGDYAVEAQPNAESLKGAAVTPGLFPLLGVQPQIGAGLPRDSGDAPGVLISERLWQRRFGGDPAALGRPLAIDGVAHRIAGVMPPRFRFPEFADVWVPVDRHVAREGRDARTLFAVARLRDGADSRAVDDALAALGKALETSDAEAMAGWTLEARPFRRFFTDGAGEFFGVLLAAVCAVLLVTCGNLAGLVIARSAERRGELGMRSALGARRGRLLRQLLTEQLLLAAIGGALALLVARSGIELLRWALPAEIPYFIELELDARILLFTVVLALLASLLVGVVPAIRATGLQLLAVLGTGGRQSADRGQARARRVLIAVELALTLLLMAGAMAMLGAAQRDPNARLNYDPHGLYVSQIDLLGERYATIEARTAAALRVRDAVAQQGLRATLVGYGMFERGDADDAEAGRLPDRFLAVSPEYFDVLGLPLRAGTAFRDGAQPTDVIVGEALAQRLWPGEQAVGRTLTLRPQGGQSAAYTVVGVAADAERAAAGQPAQRRLYLPLRDPGREIGVQVRAPSGAAAEPLLRDAVHAADPHLTLQPLRDVGVRDDGQDWQVRFFSVVLTSFAALATLAALIGLYGIVAASVTLRRREFGVRLALGADPVRLRRAVLREGALLIACGALPGAALAVVLLPRLAGVQNARVDAMPYLVATVVLLVGTALAATWWPARRAALTDPIAVLRQE